MPIPSCMAIATAFGSAAVYSDVDEVDPGRLVVRCKPFINCCRCANEFNDCCDSDGANLPLLLVELFI